MWKLFKIQLYQKLSSNHKSKTRFSDDVFDSIDSCYKRHIDIQSGGGRLTPSAREKVVRTALRGLSRANVNSRTPKSINYTLQLSAYIYSYWTLRVIQGPVGNTLVLFPGVFQAPKIDPNKAGNALDFIDALADALIQHKSTMAGITINHFPPAVTPWSGTSFTSFDEVTSIGGIMGDMINVLSSNLNDKINAGYLEAEDKQSILNGFSSNMSSILTPIVNINNNLPVIGKSNVLR